jgi:hypothetical protein
MKTEEARKEELRQQPDVVLLEDWRQGAFESKNRISETNKMACACC